MRSFRSTPLPGRLALSTSLLFLLAATAGEAASVKAPPAAEEAPVMAPVDAKGGDCAARYRQSLQQIRDSDFARLATARPQTIEGDPRLPGQLIFPPQPRQRTRPEIAALNLAGALARTRGRSVTSLDQDRAWIADRLRADLGDYLGQKQTPYLCGGVPQYLETMTGYAERIGPSPDRRRQRVADQRASAAKALDAALTSLAPLAQAAATSVVAAPMPGNDALRPSGGIERVDGATGTAAAVATPANSATAPIAAQTPPVIAPASTAPSTLASEADLVTAVEGLMRAGEAAKVLPEAVDKTQITGSIGATPGELPVIALLAAVKPFVLGPGSTIKDTPLRRTVATAFSEIELLDYLLRADAGPADPAATALFCTLDAIRAAHDRDCTCGK